MTALQNNDQYIGQLLLKDGIISVDDLGRGLEEQRKCREYLCTTLVRLGFASEEKIFTILSLQLGVPFLSLKEMHPDALVLSRVPGKLASACRCLPLKVVDHVLYVAMTDPLNTQMIDEVKGYLGVDSVKIFLVGDNDMCEAIKKYYGL